MDASPNHSDGDQAAPTRMSRLNGPTDVSALPAITRRNFLYITTAAVGTVGIIAAVWPLIDQMNPDAHIRAVGDIVELDLTDLRPAQQRVARWHHLSVFVIRRTAGMLASMQENSLVERLRDPQSKQRQEPPSARNWHRSIDPPMRSSSAFAPRAVVFRSTLLRLRRRTLPGALFVRVALRATIPPGASIPALPNTIFWFHP